MLTIQHIVYLLHNARKDNLSESEKIELKTWRTSQSSNEDTYQRLMLGDEEEVVLAELESFDTEAALARLKERMVKPTLRSKLWNRIYWVAASLLVFLSIGIGLRYYWSNQVAADYTMVLADSIKNKIVPGRDRALLTLADGSQIDLDSISSTEFVELQGMRVKKSADGELICEVLDNHLASGTNNVSTPTGGQHRLTLPDGTKVWLNARSSLTYPTQFSTDERRVQLQGEAYFEVERSYSSTKTKVPFFIEVDGYAVEVLGTKFNVKAYPGDDRSETTLVEGSVRVEKAGHYAVLKPGQQAKIQQAKNTFTVGNVDVQHFISWKEGYLSFDQQKIQSVMNEIARWYDVEIVYLGIPKNVHFAGRISKFSTINEVLDILELTGGCTFKVEGRRVLVMP